MQCNENLHQRRVKLSPSAAQQFFDRLIFSHCLPVGPIIGHRIHRFNDGAADALALMHFLPIHVVVGGLEQNIGVLHRMTSSRVQKTTMDLLRATSCEKVGRLCLKRPLPFKDYSDVHKLFSCFSFGFPISC